MFTDVQAVLNRLRLKDEAMSEQEVIATLADYEVQILVETQRLHHTFKNLKRLLEVARSSHEIVRENKYKYTSLLAYVLNSSVGYR